MRPDERLKLIIKNQNHEVIQEQQCNNDQCALFPAAMPDPSVLPQAELQHAHRRISQHLFFFFLNHAVIHLQKKGQSLMSPANLPSDWPAATEQ